VNVLDRLVGRVAAAAVCGAVGLCASVAMAQPAVVISQTYGGGGQSTTQPNVDYVELFNRGNQPQTLTGWSLQVSSGSDAAPWTAIPLTGVIAPGQYYLVQVYSPASGNGTALPTPDATGTSASPALLLASEGRAALVSSTTALTNPPCPVGLPSVVDFVAWGGSYACAEGGVTGPASSITMALFRAGGGCTDNGSNIADFAAAAPNPRNRRSNGFLTLSATPADLPQSNSNVVLLASRATALPCSNVLGAITSATADLTVLGGAAATPMLDDGGDDGAAGDGVFGVTVPLTTAQAVGDYYLPLTVSDGTVTTTGTVKLTIRPGPPANDTCAAAVSLGALAGPFTATVDNSAATDDQDVGTCNTGSVTKFGVWYTFTAPAAGAVFMRETGAQDAVFGVFTGPCEALLALTPTSCFALDDPSVFTATAGTTYFILVGNQSSSTTAPTTPLNLTFTFSPRPANDTCDTATDLGELASPLVATVDNAGATDDVDVTCNTGSVTRFGVWYTFMAPASGALILNETSIQDALYGVYTGTCTALTPLAPTSCFSVDANTIVPVTAGTRYYLLLGNQGSSATPPTIPFSINFTFAPTPANDLCANARAVTSFPFNETPFAPNATDDVDVSCNAATNTVTRFGVWYSITTGIDSGRLTFSESSGNDVVFAVFSGTDCATQTPVACLNESGASAGVPLAAGQTYRLLVGLNSATLNPTLPYAIALGFVADTGACCTAQGCQLLSASACSTAQGVFRGVNTPCVNVPRYINLSAAAIPDYVGPSPAPSTPLVSTLTVPAGDTAALTSLGVWINLSHAAAGDLTVRLTGPDNTTVDLIRRAGLAEPCALGVSGTANDFGGAYVISDSAGTSWASGVVSGPSPLAPGPYSPSTCGGVLTSLNTSFAGHAIAGTWTLSVADEDEGLTGTLAGWGLIINEAESPCPSGACCVQQVCTIANASECARISGTLAAGQVCTAESCVPQTGACCQGSSCAATTAAACTGANTQFAGAGTVCNAFGANNNTPCCLGDYNHQGGVTVQDIFDFLNGYFNQHPGADVNGNDGVTVQDIFDFLLLYFAGSC
jgi:subtilisin-like proprotein convertase family protein